MVSENYLEFIFVLVQKVQYKTYLCLIVVNSYLRFNNFWTRKRSIHQALYNNCVFSNLLITKEEI